MQTELATRVVEATAAGRGAAFATIVDAFEDDAASRVLYPDIAGFRAHFPTFVACSPAPPWRTSPRRASARRSGSRRGSSRTSSR